MSRRSSKKSFLDDDDDDRFMDGINLSRKELLLGFSMLLLLSMVLANFGMSVYSVNELNEHKREIHRVKDVFHKITSASDIESVYYDDDNNDGNKEVDDDNETYAINGSLFVPGNLTVHKKSHFHNDLNIYDGDLIQQNGDIITDGSVVSSNLIEIFQFEVASEDDFESKKRSNHHTVNKGSVVGCLTSDCKILEGYKTFDNYLINDTYGRSKSDIAVMDETHYVTCHFSHGNEDDDELFLFANIVTLGENNKLTIGEGRLLETVEFDGSYNYDLRCSRLHQDDHFAVFYNSPDQDDDNTNDVLVRAIRINDYVLSDLTIGSAEMVNLEADTSSLPQDMRIFRWDMITTDMLFSFTDGGAEQLSLRLCTCNTNTLSWTCSSNEPSRNDGGFDTLEDVTELMIQPGTENSLLPCGIIAFGGLERDENVYSSGTTLKLSLAYITESGGTVSVVFDGPDIPILYPNAEHLEDDIDFTFHATMMTSNIILFTVESLGSYNSGQAFLVKLSSSNVCQDAMLVDVDSTILKISTLVTFEKYEIFNDGLFPFGPLVTPVSTVIAMSDDLAVVGYRADESKNHALMLRTLKIDTMSVEIIGVGHQKMITPFLARDVVLKQTDDNSFLVVYNDFTTSSTLLEGYNTLEVSHCSLRGSHSSVNCAQHMPQLPIGIALQNGNPGEIVDTAHRGKLKMFDFGHGNCPSPVYSTCDGGLTTSDHSLAGNGDDCIPHYMGYCVDRETLVLNPSHNQYSLNPF